MRYSITDSERRVFLDILPLLLKEGWKIEPPPPRYDIQESRDGQYAAVYDSEESLPVAQFTGPRALFYAEQELDYLLGYGVEGDG